MTVQEIIALLEQQGVPANVANQLVGSGGGGAAASVPASTFGLTPGPAGGLSGVGASTSGGGSSANGIGSLLTGGAGGGGSILGGLAGSLFGGNPNSTSASLGGTAGSTIGGIGGLLLGGPVGSLIGSFGGGFLGDLVGGLIGGGLPHEAKTESLAGGAVASGNPLEQILGQYLNTGAQLGHVTSESSPSNFESAAGQLINMLQALTGQQLPTITGTGAGIDKQPTFTPNLGFAASNFKLPAGYQFINSPQGIQQAATDIQSLIGFQQPGLVGPVAESNWNKVVQDLISQGVLQKYSGSLGAVGNAGAPTASTAIGSTAGGSSAIPNIALPHPLAQTGVSLPQPYPL